jgi:hypothetical protein
MFLFRQHDDCEHQLCRAESFDKTPCANVVPAASVVPILNGLGIMTLTIYAAKQPPLI